MMVDRPRYVRSETVLRYNGLDVSALADRLKAVSEDTETKPRQLHPNWAMSAPPKRIVLLSPTGSSAAIIAARQTTLQTRYFADFIVLKEHAKRRDYMLEKVSALCDLLAQVQVAPTFIGIISIVRLTVETSESVADLRRRISNAPMLKHAAQSLQGAWHDFSVRVAGPVNHLYFENLEISWYEERVFSIVESPELPRNLEVNEWEIPVESQGLEIKIDMNNKLGLMNGRRNWSTNDLTAFVEQYYANSERLLSSALDLSGIEVNNAT